MVRDKIKNKEYYDNYIVNLERRINKRKEKFNNNLIDESRIKIVKRAMSGQYLNLLKARFSNGENIENQEFTSHLTKSISLLYENWEPNLGLVPYKENGENIFLNQYGESFITILELISLSILFNIDDYYFNLLVGYIDRDKVDDFLFEYLIRYKLKDREIKKKESYKVFFGINEKYGRLKEIIKENNKVIAQNELKFFLEEEWYPSFLGTPIHNQHLNSHNTYVGYWCFVSAAIVKIKELDDSSFRDNQYYPKDLLSTN